MAKYLQRPALDDDFRRKLEAEEELDTIFDQQEAKYEKFIAEAKEQEARREAEIERIEKKDIKVKFANKLKDLGFSDQQIIDETGLISADYQ